jgi:predicted RNA binding protein YcfA (HicA-like mRNA interferase family)
VVSESRQQKQWAKLNAHPRSVSFDELRHLLELSGWTLVRTSGSHHVFECGTQRLTVPYRRPHVLPIYVRLVLAATDPSKE